MYGPILCNKVGLKSITTIGPNIECESSIFVDDIEQAGSHIDNIETAAANCSIMETTRKFTFNNETDKTAFMVVNPKRNNKIEKLRNCIKKGNICRTYEYNYLGGWYNEKGNHEKSLQEKEKKVGILW